MTPNIRHEIFLKNLSLSFWPNAILNWNPFHIICYHIYEKHRKHQNVNLSGSY